MSTVVVIQILAIALLLVSAVESLRARPWWPHSPGRPVSRGPARGTSPRERRWLHGGLALVLGANVVGVQVDGGTAVGVAGLLMLVVGGTAIVVGLVRGPTPGDVERFEQRYAAELSDERGDGESESS
jgi:hypothetical protein